MDREKVIKGLEMCLADEYCNGCPYEEDCFDSDSDNPWGSGVMRDAIALLKEQEELLRKLQKDKDKLCLEVSEWKHKYHDRPLKEQDAVEPRNTYSTTPSGKVIPHIFCGKCNKEIYAIYAFCPFCGQAVKWE